MGNHRTGLVAALIAASCGSPEASTIRPDPSAQEAPPSVAPGPSEAPPAVPAPEASAPPAEPPAPPGQSTPTDAGAPAKRTVTIVDCPVLDGSANVAVERAYPGKTIAELVDVRVVHEVDPAIARPPARYSHFEATPFLRDGAIAVLCGRGTLAFKFFDPPGF